MNRVAKTLRCPSAKTAPGPAKIWFWPLRALPVCLRCGRLSPNRSAGHLSVFTRKAPPLYRTRTRPKIWPLHGSIKKQISPFKRHNFGRAAAGACADRRSGPCRLPLASGQAVTRFGLPQANPQALRF